MVAVGFNPRKGIPQPSRVAWRRLNSRSQMPFFLFDSVASTGLGWGVQPSLRDGGHTKIARPWAETHGYHQMSLRD